MFRRDIKSLVYIDMQFINMIICANLGRSNFINKGWVL
jgi:hypothetical protein